MAFQAVFVFIVDVIITYWMYFTRVTKKDKIVTANDVNEKYVQMHQLS